MKLEIGMKVLIHETNREQLLVAIALGVQGRIVTITKVDDTHVEFEYDDPLMGQFRIQHASAPLRCIFVQAIGEI